MRAKQLVNLGHLDQLPADQSERSVLEPDAEQLVFMTRTVCVRLAQGHINLDLVTEAEGSYKCTPPSTRIHQLLYEIRIHHLPFQGLFTDLRAIITLDHM